MHISPSKFQPVAADDVASTLADVAVSKPKNGAVELAGPEVSSFAEFVQSFLAAKGDQRKVIADPSATYFGAVLSERELVPAPDAETYSTTFAEWLAAAK